MRLEISISLSRFGWASLEERAGADGFELAEVTEQACAYYASELDSGRPATKLPRFDHDDPTQTARRLSLELDDDCAERLNREAERQGVSLQSLLRHATLMYLADLDAGRVAGRVAQGAEQARRFTRAS
jgi:hypothetical protein